MPLIGWSVLVIRLLRLLVCFFVVLSLALGFLYWTVLALAIQAFLVSLGSRRGAMVPRGRDLR